MAADRPLWRNRDFGVFWGAQTLSVAGDSFSYVALPLLVLHATGSVARMGLLTGLAGAASVVTGVFAGVLVDRVDRRRLLIGCDLARALLYALIPAVWLAGPHTWLLYLVVPLGAAFGMVFRVGYVAVLPGLVGTDRITEANGRLSATYAVATVSGPALAGTISGLFGPTAAVAVDAATFGVSALGLALIRLTAPAPAAAASAAPGPSWWQDFLAGVRFLRRQPVLRSLTVLLSLFGFLTLGLTDVFVFHLKHDLGGLDRTVGAVLAVGEAGTVVGALLVARIRRSLGFGPSWIGAHTLAGLAVAGVGVATDTAAVAGLIAAYMFCLAVAGICSMSLRQQVTPDHLLGRVTAAFWTIHSSLGPLGAALLTVAVATYGTRVACLVAGGACAAVGLAGALTPVRRRNPELVPAADPAPAAVPREPQPGLSG